MLLFHHGQFLDDAMKRERVAHDEVVAAIRSAGVTNVNEVPAVVLETDGTLSVLREAPDPVERSSLRNVNGAGAAP